MSQTRTKIKSQTKTIADCVTLAFSILVFLTSSLDASSQIDIARPVGSPQSSITVTVLPNGNIVVTDPLYDAPGPIADVGAVYLYNGKTGELISTLTGSTEDDNVGRGGVTVLTNGNYIVRSENWDGTAEDVGAVTFCSGRTGVSGVVSSANSLVGSSFKDNVGSDGITALTNGNYVVRSTTWDYDAATDAGAVTFANGSTGVSGVVSSANSLVGSAVGDQIGSSSVTALANGNYIVRSLNWDGIAADVGAVTFGNGTNGIAGVVSSANSLVGSTASDSVGNLPVTVLSNGNYVVRSQFWDGTAVDVGAVTFGSGTTGISGVVSSGNSLIGSSQNDQVGGQGVTALANGNYVVRSSSWDGTAEDAGAVTFGSGVTGISGVVSYANSLVGSAPNDSVGNGGVRVLKNGNYSVLSPNWNRTGANVGAITFGNGKTGVSGVVSPANSIVGFSIK